MIDQLAPTVDRMGASAAWLLTLDGSGGQLRTAAADGAEVIARHLSTPLDQVMDTGQPEFLATRKDVRDRFGSPPDVGSVALLPLLAGERCVGVLGASFADERELSADDRGYLAALAGIASLALARAC